MKPNCEACFRLLTSLGAPCNIGRQHARSSRSSVFDPDNTKNSFPGNTRTRLEWYYWAAYERFMALSDGACRRRFRSVSFKQNCWWKECDQESRNDSLYEGVIVWSHITFITLIYVSCPRHADRSVTNRCGINSLVCTKCASASNR